MNDSTERPYSLDIDELCNDFKKVADKKATRALQFYEDNAKYISINETIGKELGFNWNECRAYCSVGKSYSHSRFKQYVAKFFHTTVREMDTQWNNINYKNH